MRSLKVKDLMIPLAKCPTVSENATLREAMSVLETTRMRVDAPEFRPRFVLVHDAKYNIVGTLRQSEVLRSLEPKYSLIDNSESRTLFESDPHAAASMIEKFDLWSEPLADTCRKAKERRIKDIVTKPVEGEIIDEQASLAKAVHMMLIGNRLSLIVTSKKGFVGIVRLSDIFSFFSNKLKKANQT